jgi:hypothetical protein
LNVARCTFDGFDGGIVGWDGHKVLCTIGGGGRRRDLILSGLHSVQRSFSFSRARIPINRAHPTCRITFTQFSFFFGGIFFLLIFLPDLEILREIDAIVSLESIYLERSMDRPTCLLGIETKLDGDIGGEPVFLDECSEGVEGVGVFLVEGAFYVEALGEVGAGEELVYLDCCFEGAEAGEN